MTEQFKERYGFAQAAKATILVELGSAARAMATQRLAAAFAGRRAGCPGEIAPDK